MPRGVRRKDIGWFEFLILMGVAVILALPAGWFISQIVYLLYNAP